MNTSSRTVQLQQRSTVPQQPDKIREIRSWDGRPANATCCVGINWGQHSFTSETYLQQRITLPTKKGPGKA